MKVFSIAAVIFSSWIAAVQAEEVTVSRALAAGSLHEGALDMVAYWTEAPDGALEVTATFRNRATSDAPMRIVMAMQDGDALAFSMPGYERSLYRFARTGTEILISVEIGLDRLALAN